MSTVSDSINTIPVDEELVNLNDSLYEQGHVSQDLLPIQETKTNISAEHNTRSPLKTNVNPKKPVANSPTPTIKKVINSGTFGAGAAKPTVAKTLALKSSAASRSLPATKKVVTSAPFSSAKPISSKISSTPANPSRRPSVVPKNSPLAKPSVSTLVDAKNLVDNGPVRASVSSPTGSIGSSKVLPNVRPRASMSEGLKTASPSRSNITSSAAKSPPLSRTSASLPSKSSKLISSIQEVKESIHDPLKGTKGLAELQSQETNESLRAKSDTVFKLEFKVEDLNASLFALSKKMESTIESKDILEKAHQIAEEKLNETQKILQTVQNQLNESNSSLHDVQLAVQAKEEIVLKLKARHEELEIALSISEKKISALEDEIHIAKSTAAVEHQALNSAQSDLKALAEKADSLEAGRIDAVQESERLSTELSGQANLVESLQSQNSYLKAEKEEIVSKLSELEIEILELKETQDGLEDTRIQLERRTASLEEELANAVVATGLAVDALSKKDAEFAQMRDELVKKHNEDLKIESSRYSDMSISFGSLKAQYSEVIEALERSQKTIVANEQNQALILTELEQAHLSERAVLLGDMEKMSQQLQSQEALYNLKVDAVKLEHENLLREAFERAKKEASETHSQELQVLRSSSSATIEQLKTAKQIAMDAIQAEHESHMETEVNTFLKQVNNLNLELKATHDDLAKAKTALDLSRKEVDCLNLQLDAARSVSEAASSIAPEQAEEIARLTKELFSAKDDFKAASEMLELMKSSMSELNDNHKRELEEVAKIRADEVLKLLSSHELELETLGKQKSGLVIQISDLQGELATARAVLEKQHAAISKSNENGVHDANSPSVVTKEELTRMHEAHNLKLYDLQAEHEKAIKSAKDELDGAFMTIGELRQDLTRKAMEIQYLEQDQEENQEQIIRLKEDLHTLTESFGHGQAEDKL